MNFFGIVVLIGVVLFLCFEIVGFINDINRRRAKKKEQNAETIEPNEVNESKNEND